MTGSKSSHRRCSIKKAVLKNFAIFKGKHLTWSLFLINLQAWRSATLKKTPTQLFSFEFCEIFKNTYSEEHVRTTAFEGPLNPLHFSFYTTWEHQKMRHSDTFSGCTKRPTSQNGLIHHCIKAKQFLYGFLLIRL